MQQIRQGQRLPRRSGRRQRGSLSLEGFVALLVIGAVGIPVLLVFGLALRWGKGAKGKLVGFLVACVVCSPVLWPVTQSWIENVRRNRLVAAVSSICQRELQQTTGPLLIDGFVDETNGLGSRDIQYALTEMGLRFVEVKVSKGVALAGREHPWQVDRNEGYARFQLEDRERGNCYVPPDTKPDDFFVSNAPFRPSSCLTMTTSASPTARYMVDVDAGTASSLSRWVLRDRSTDTVIIGFTDALYALSQARVTPYLTWHKRGCGAVDGYSTLLAHMEGTPEARTHASGHVLHRAALEVSGIPGSVYEVVARRGEHPFPLLHSTAGPFRGERASLRDDRVTWRESYALAEQHGAWVHQRTWLIRPGLQKMVEIRHKGLYGKWGTTGEQLVFVQANELGDRIAIFGADFEGKMLWTAQLAPLTPSTDTPIPHFLPERFELTDTALLVHGDYDRSGGDASDRSWTISIPRAELAALLKASLKP